MAQSEDPLAEGDRLVREGEREKAVEAYDAAVDGAPLTARARAADVLLELGRMDAALERAEAAWRMAPEAPEALLLMGRIAWRARAVREALTCLDRIPESSSLWPEAQAERAEALLAARRADEAYEDLRSALKQHSTRITARDLDTTVPGANESATTKSQTLVFDSKGFLGS